jgi:hypothetical protein
VLADFESDMLNPKIYYQVRGEDLLKTAGFPEGQAERGSQKWLQKLINEKPNVIDAQLRQHLELSQDELIEWLSPRKEESYREYYDEAFLEKLGLAHLIPDLREFWPKGGPHWDGLGKSSSNKIFLVEAKSHIPELISSSDASDPNSICKIQKSLNQTKKDLESRSDFDWSKTFYQYANRLAHVNFLRKKQKNAHFVSVYFLNDSEMKGPKTVDEWKGALRLLHRCLCLEEHTLSKLVVELFIDVNCL